jgi:hypothetical protein
MRASGNTAMSAHAQSQNFVLNAAFVPDHIAFMKTDLRLK